MAWWIASQIQYLWPFSRKKIDDDVRVSNGLVGALSLPESTKQFVFALRDPDSSSVVYLLAAENLSERSASDAKYLVRAVRPNVVVAQIGPSALEDVRAEESNLCESVPTSLLGVLKGCFLERINWSKYENRAGSQVLQTIFGTGFYGHVLAAKQAALESHSVFLFLETPSKNSQSDKLDAVNEQTSNQNAQDTSGKTSLAAISQIRTFFDQLTALQSDMALSVPMSYKRYTVPDPLQSSVKSLASSMALSLRNSLALDSGSHSDSIPNSASPTTEDANYRIPRFAHSFYSLLVDLHEMFNTIPAVDRALGYAQRMLSDVEQGKEVDCHVVAQGNRFRIAVEGLRIALNSAAHGPIKKDQKNSKDVEFNDLPYKEKCHFLFAQALRRQAQQGDKIVAIVDASSLFGIRKYWTTPVPKGTLDLANECFIADYDDGANGDDANGRGRLVDKPIVAVGAGAATVIGISSFPKIVPVSSLMKIATFKAPGVVKLGLLHTKRSAATAMGKFFMSAKIVAPASQGAIPGKLAFGSGIHTPAAVKAAAAAEKLRAVTHAVIASAERSSLSAMRTAFYGIMRNRRGRATGATPWVTFGGSILACTGLLAFGDGIECAAESAPAMPATARLGRGLENLRHASQAVCQMESAQAWETIYNSLYSLKKGQ